ncbi:putative high-affinity branched-chain amino acid transport system permease protein BraE [Advenella mimigardefordensis DPN7]|uniref:Putative high-affinity branched-chain amino acid transport system permease protein BraE n=2 Tax=Advenella mimigardefordensis TaxID=302406 RepID=W0PBI9_ADVMD|nr:putative high-affinity branched-chain amino acid transport system permease protein BraE [Advenella mimigardefordensis DPN7]
MRLQEIKDTTFFKLMLAWALAIALYGLLIENTFLLTLAGYTSTLALFALSINVMLGGVGEVPLGQSLFFGLGAYAVGIGMQKLGFSYALSVLSGIAITIALSFVIGMITLRLTGAYFAIVSWGMASVAVVAVLNLESVTGGGMGIFGLPDMQFFTIDLTSPIQYFYTAAATLLLIIVILNAIRQSRFGYALESVRQNPHLATSLGVNVFRQRLKAFMLSAVIATIAGALSVPYTQIITHESLNIAITVDALLMVLLGGTRWLFGPVLGAMII